MNTSSKKRVLKYGIGVAHTLDDAWFDISSGQNAFVASDHGHELSITDLRDDERAHFSELDPSWQHHPVIMGMLEQMDEKFTILEIDHDTEITLEGDGALTFFIRIPEAITVTIRESVLSSKLKARVILSVEKDSKVHYITTSGSDQHHTTILRQAFLSDQSSLVFLGAEVIGDDNISQYISYLRGEGAESNQYIAYAARDTAIRDIYTKVHHEAAHTSSQIDVRGVQRDSSVSFYRGVVAMSPGVIGASGHQQTRILLLSPQAKAHAVPNLEVGHNDVSCSHAVGISYIDDVKTFYLESRGMTEEDAHQMIIQAHMHEILAHFPEDIRTVLIHTLI